MKNLTPKKLAILIILGVSCITLVPMIFLLLNMACAYTTRDSVLAHLLNELQD